MQITGRSVLLTGAGRGIGAAMALRFARERPRGIAVSDIDGAAARRTAGQVCAAGVPAIAVEADVADAEQVAALVAQARDAHHGLDVVCSNAGVAGGSGLYASAADWSRSWNVNVMGHVHVAQAALPSMVRAGGGYLVLTASALGLFAVPGDAPYTVTKFATIGLAEWLATTFHENGINVSALCPLGVRTDMFAPALAARHPAATAVNALGPMLEASTVAEAVVQGMAEERFLILPHAGVAEAYARKASDPDEWIARHAAARKPAPRPRSAAGLDVDLGGAR